MMKPGKLIFLTMAFMLLLAGVAFAVGEDVIVAGDTQAASLSLEPVSRAAMPSGSEGEVIYSNDADDNTVFVYDGTDWVLFSANKNVSTKIVAALNSLDISRADYICDGTDDQQEINQAIIDAYYNPNNSGLGGVVYLLDGTYNISDKTSSDGLSYTNPIDGSAINITDKGIIMRGNVSLVGAGKGTVLKVVVTAGFNVINASSINGILISRLAIDGNNTVVYGNNSGIVFSSVTNSNIDKVWVENMRGNSNPGIRLTSSSGNVISSVKIQRSMYAGIKLTSSSDNVISNSSIMNNGGVAAVEFDASDNNIFSENNVWNSTGVSHGIYLSSSSNNIITNNNIQGNGGDGIAYIISPSLNNVLSGNNIQGNGGMGIDIDWRLSNNNIISANNIQDNGSHGIFAQASSGNQITGNIISDNGNSYDGIHIKGSSFWLSENNMISFNYISNLSDSSGSGYGINIEDTFCQNNYLAGNYIYPYDAAGINLAFAALINDAGTGTKYTGKEKLTLERVTDSLSSVSPDAAYIKITSGSITIEDGKSAGDILILEGPDTGTAVLSGNIRFCSAHSNHDLSANDNLTLIWNDDAFSATPVPSWLELSFSDN